MNKKVLIFICFLILILIIIFLIIHNNFENKLNQKTNNILEESDVRIEYNDGNQVYIVYDKTSNEIKTIVSDETSLKVYEDNPDYNPNPDY